MKERKEIKILDIPEIVVLDMDGTLYQLDGENNTIKNSTLMNKVISNSVEFVMTKEGCKKIFAEELIAEAFKDSIGISNVLSKRYAITRANYFDIAWNINPKEVIKNFEVPILAVQKLRRDGKRLFLLTAAPRVWMENVVNELNLGSIFERKYHGEMFGPKTEIFEALAKEFDPAKIVSIGDQFKSDLEPAQKLGMGIFHVKKPEDLLLLI